MGGADTHIYEFGEFRVEAGRRMLLRNGDPIPLTPKVFDTLLHLVKRNGEVLEKEELMRAVWPDTIVEENNLNQNISTLRRVLKERNGENRYILTIPGRGYRFIASVQIVEAVPEKTGPVTLAVLPFENLSADAEREYLADGLTEETIAALGQIGPGNLSVIGRTSVMAYKRTSKSAAEIGRELGAAYLIEGSLRAESGRLRITSRLIRVRDQVQVWSASYDSEPSSMLVFQRELSAVIAQQVHLQLSPKRLTALGRRQTRNAEAFDLYLHGRHFWHQLSPMTTRRAAEYYTRAVELDPHYALAWSGLADGYSASPINGDAAPLQVWPKAREAVENALRAQPELAEVQTSLGFMKFWLAWDWPGAEVAYHKAIELNPGYPLAHRLLGILLSHMDRREEAKAAAAHARELDPLLAGHRALSSQVAFAGRDFDAALRFARQAIVVDPGFWIGFIQLAQVCIELGRTEQALEALGHAGQKSGGNSKVLSLRGYLFARLGRKKEAEEVLSTLQAISRERYVPPYASALIYAGLEQPELALEWLGRGLETHDVHLAFLTIDPKWDNFRSDSRFQAMVRQCRFMDPEPDRPHS
jgi:DNA-binding winged helix-turn-helix (wHTH) protein/Tfp pilus assembly protein PilF